MGRSKLSMLNWKQLQKEMSIAGDPETMIEIAKDIHALITPRMNMYNLAELENIELVLMKILADFKYWENYIRSRQHPKQ